MLFRYPYKVSTPKKQQNTQNALENNETASSSSENGDYYRHNFYKLPADLVDEDTCKAASESLSAENLPEFPSKVLSNMFAVHSELCDKKFELKINDVRFVGHPLSLKVKPGEARNFARDIKSHFTMFQVGLSFSRFIGICGIFLNIIHILEIGLPISF